MDNSKLEVAVIGNVGIDTNVYFHGQEPDFQHESNFTENIDYVGQAGGYSSRCYAALGYRAAFVGYVGDDHNGEFIRKEFGRDGIDTRALFIDAEGTSRSINFMYPDGRRKNFYDGKGHMQLEPDIDHCLTILREAKLAHFHIPNWARKLLRPAKELGLFVATDIQDVVTIDDPYREDFIRHSDALFFSAVNQSDPIALIRSFLKKSAARIVVAGMGSQGCAVGTREDIRTFPAVRLPISIIDTNGAGDGLAVGFLSSYVLEGLSLEDSIQRGQLVARHCCGQKASSSQLLSRQELVRYARSSR